jgi:NMD protein affecting ribosome stability and mRNA decay
MLSKIECPRCGVAVADFVRGLCRACYMRAYHQRRSAEAVTQCPSCGVVSANFVKGLCRVCYMRAYHQRRSAAAVTDKQRVFETSSPIDDSAGQRFCIECKAPSIYARSLCRNCYMRGYMRDRQHRRRQRFCVECGAPGIYARSLCQNCYMQDRRRHHRIKRCVCAVCGVSFQSVRRDALYCSLSCRQKAHRAGKTQLLPKVAIVDERRAVQSAIDALDVTLAPRTEVQAHAVADIDRRLGRIESTIIEDVPKCGRTDTGLSANDDQRKARQMLAGRHREASTLADLNAELTLAAKSRPIEAEAALVRLAEPMGLETDSERKIRWLLALMMMWCDPPAGAPTAAASARNRPRSDAASPKIMDDVLQVVD